MRDAKDALRNQVRALEDELAEKEAELARLRREQEEGPASEPEPESKPAPQKKRPKRKPGPAPEIRLGTLRPDGSVRYLVRPLAKAWIGIMAVVALILTSVIVGGAISEGNIDTFPWPALLPIVLLPAMLTFRAGFDIDVAKKKIFVWESWGPFTTSSFKLHRLLLPEIRTRMETFSSDSGDTRSRVTRLYWGSKNVRCTIDASLLSEIMTEVRALADSAED